MSTTIIPTLGYRDAAAAIEFLCNAFGFEKLLVVPGENGTIAHAQLTYGNVMIMLGSSRDDDFDKLQKPPGDVGGIGTQSPYVIVADADVHYRRRWMRGLRSSWTSLTRTTVVECTRVGTPKATCGTSARTIRG